MGHLINRSWCSPLLSLPIIHNTIGVHKIHHKYPGSNRTHIEEPILIANHMAAQRGSNKEPQKRNRHQLTERFARVFTNVTNVGFTNNLRVFEHAKYNPNENDDSDVLEKAK
uniref:Uncharacterized protein n=1 Tax=Cacopsylla melanoneura TaxID=428564 RepID=A0A8D8VRD5_9HEMI